MAGAPLGTRTAAKQSESKSKLMPNLFESRGLRRLWASHGQAGSNPSRPNLPHYFRVADNPDTIGYEPVVVRL